jgi:hypothetical protein
VGSQATLRKGATNICTAAVSPLRLQGPDSGDATTPRPRLRFVAEVLSPPTARADLGDKAAEYLQRTSLMTYLVFEQNQYKAHIWTREADGFPPAPTVIGGRDRSCGSMDFI